MKGALAFHVRLQEARASSSNEAELGQRLLPERAPKPTVLQWDKRINPAACGQARRDQRGAVQAAIHNCREATKAMRDHVSEQPAAHPILETIMPWASKLTWRKHEQETLHRLDDIDNSLHLTEHLHDQWCQPELLGVMDSHAFDYQFAILMLSFTVATTNEEIEALN